MPMQEKLNRQGQEHIMAVANTVRLWEALHQAIMIALTSFSPSKWNEAPKTCVLVELSIPEEMVSMLKRCHETFFPHGSSAALLETAIFTELITSGLREQAKHLMQLVKEKKVGNQVMSMAGCITGDLVGHAELRAGPVPPKADSREEGKGGET